MLRLYSKIFQNRNRALHAVQSMPFSSDKEAVDILAQLDEKRSKDGSLAAKSTPYVFKKKDTVVYIKNLQDQAKFLSLLKINTSLALCIGIEKSTVTALVLSNIKGIDRDQNVELHQDGDIKIPLRSLGNIIDFAGNTIFEEMEKSYMQPESDFANEHVNLISGLGDAPFKRQIVSRQLYTGHLRIDLNQPMVENNFIVLKGPSNSGKNLVVKDMIKYYLSEHSLKGGVPSNNNGRYCFIIAKRAQIYFINPIYQFYLFRR